MTDTPKRITDDQDRTKKGLTLCDTAILEDILKDVMTARKRHAAYIESLPSEPEEVSKAITRALTDVNETYSGIPRVLALLTVMEAALTLQESDGWPDGRYLANVCDLAYSLLKEQHEKLVRAWDLACRPSQATEAAS